MTRFTLVARFILPAVALAISACGSMNAEKKRQQEAAETRARYTLGGVESQNDSWLQQKFRSMKEWEDERAAAWYDKIMKD